MKKIDPDVLTNYYDIGIVRKLTTISNGTANELFYIEDDENRYVLRKRSSRYSDKIQLEYEIEYLLHLADNGIPVPVPIITREGGRYFTFASDKYQLYPFIDGDSYDFGSVEGLKESARFLARLHNALEDFCPKVQKSIPRMDDPVAVSKVLDGFIEKAPRMSEVEEKTINHLKEELSGLIEEFGDDEYYSLPKTIIHGDYHPANVKFSRGRVCGLFDFDWISLQPRMSDVVDGLIYFASKRDKALDGADIFSLVEDYELDRERSEIFLDTYSEDIYSILSEDEAASAPLFMKARLINNRVDALRKIPFDKALDMLTSGIMDKLRWVDKNIDIFMNRR